jgi:hypothetical protein
MDKLCICIYRTCHPPQIVHSNYQIYSNPSSYNPNCHNALARTNLRVQLGMSQQGPPAPEKPDESPQQTAIDPTKMDPKDELAYYESKRGQGWQDPNNMKILTEWIHYSAIYLDILSEAAEGYRKTLRLNTIFNLIVSTLASTLSVSTFNTSELDSPRTALALKIIFTTLTFGLTIAAGYIKVYQIQEKLENSLRLKQEWALFGSKISSEMQLPLILRKNAIFLISTMKGTYLDLVKSDMGIKKEIIRRMAVRSGLREDDLTLSELFERVIRHEINRLMDESETRTSPDVEKQLDTIAASYGLETAPQRRMSRAGRRFEDEITQALREVPASVAIPVEACEQVQDQTAQIAEIKRAVKEAEMIKAAAAAVAGSGLKGFFNRLAPPSEAKTQKDDNARQLLADRGRVSSFLRSTPARSSGSGPLSRSTQRGPRRGSSGPEPTSCPTCRAPMEDQICAVCDLPEAKSVDSSAASVVSQGSV